MSGFNLNKWKMFDGKSSSLKGGQLIYTGNALEVMDLPFGFYTVFTIKEDTEQFGVPTPNVQRMLDCVNGFDQLQRDYDAVKNVPDQIGRPLEAALKTLGVDTEGMSYQEMAERVGKLVIKQATQIDEMKKFLNDHVRPENYDISLRADTMAYLRDRGWLETEDTE